MDHAESNSPQLRSVVPARSVRARDVAAPIGPPRADGTTEPQVELVREGGVVRAVDFTCGCGQRHRLRCVYEQEGAAGS